MHGSTIVPNSLVIDKQTRTIKVILDATSFPTVRGLTGTVFTIVLASLPPDTTQVTTQISPQVALAATSGTTASDSSSGLSSSVTLRTSDQPTLSLTPTTGGQAGDHQLTLSSGGGSDTPPSEDELPSLWKILLEFWRIVLNGAGA